MVRYVQLKPQFYTLIVNAMVFGMTMLDTRFEVMDDSAPTSLSGQTDENSWSRANLDVGVLMIQRAKRDPKISWRRSDASRTIYVLAQAMRTFDGPSCGP